MIFTLIFLFIGAPITLALYLVFNHLTHTPK